MQTQLKDPELSEQAAFAPQVCVPRLHSFRLLQLVPDPEYPALQAHTKEPAVFVQEASSAQLLLAPGELHSLISAHVTPFPVKPTVQKQLDWEELPVWDVVAPNVHAVHGAEPVVFLKLPTAQSEQVPPFGPEKPSLQTQVEAATDDWEFAAQGVQEEADPVVFLKVPAGQGEQTEPSSPMNPGEHLQFMIEVLADAEVELTGHKEHPPPKPMDDL